VLQRDHHILFLCARYDDSRLAQNAVLGTEAGGAACQQGYRRIGNALQTIKGLIEHFADFLGQCWVGSTLPTAGNTVFLSHSRNWFHRLCRKCVCLYRTACQQGKSHHSRHANRNRLFHSIVSSSYCVSLPGCAPGFVASFWIRMSRPRNCTGLKYFPKKKKACVHSPE